MHPPITRSGPAGEQGSVSLILAVVVLGLVVAGLWGANTAALIGVRRETQRAADLTALAAAANLPLVGALSASEPETTGCAQAAALLTASASPLIHGLSTSGPVVCDHGVTVDADAEWDTIATVETALEDLVADLGLSAPNLCLPLVARLVDPWLVTVGATGCAQLRAAVNGMPANLAPATVTPLVNVAIRAGYEAPVPTPQFDGTHEVAADATARRRFKNLIVLPATPAGLPAGLSDFNPNQSAATVRDVLVPRAIAANAALGAAVDPLLPPGVSFDLSQLIADARDLYDPPSGATGPTPLDVASEAALTGEPVVLLRLFRMPVLGIPALDFTAAYLAPLAAGHFRAVPIPAAQLASARGIFRASLVR